MYRIGLDIGSTTIKTAVLDEKDNLVHSSYQRHNSDVRATLYQVLKALLKDYDLFTVTVTGSGGISVSEWLGIPFVQEVIAGVEAIRRLIPETDVAIELGGEDAKITYLKGSVDQRMNGTCAGGTGAFIDQMAVLLNTDAQGLNELAKDAGIIYPIASRCGVFAKSDIQPLINDGAKKSDVAASVFQSVVNQTISGLACGKPIRGNVAFLGGPLHFLSELGRRFVVTLQPQKAIFPENSQVFNAIYGEGGSQEVPESEIRAKFETDYAKIIVIPLSFSGSEDEETKKEADQNTRDTINGYKQRADAGEDMEDLVYEARKQATGDEDLEKPEAGSSYTFVNRNNSQYGQPVTDAIFAAANGVPTVFEDENSIFLFTRYDITENENDFTSRKASILAEMKSQEFDALIAEWAIALSDVTYNEAAFKRYSAEKLKLS